MATDTPIGTRIKRARERLHWTQRQLADALEVDEKTVRNWEADRGYPRNRIGALEQVLGVRFDDDDDGSHARPISPQLRRLITETLDDEEDRRRVIGLLEGTLTWPDEREAPAQREEPASGDRHRTAG